MLFTEKNNKNLKKYILIYIVATILLLLQQVLVGEAPLILNIMIDSAVLGKPMEGGHMQKFLSMFVNIEKGLPSIVILSFIVLVFYLFSALFSYISGLLSSIATEGIIHNLRSLLHASIQRFTYAHYAKEESGDLLQRCTSNVETIKKTFSHFIIQGISIIFSICYIFSIMLSQNVKMALFSSCTVPIIFISCSIFFVYIKKQYNLAYERESEMAEAVNENLHGIRVVKAFSMQNYEIEKFEKSSLESRNVWIKINKVEGFFWGVCDAITFAQIMFVTLYGSYLVSIEEMTLGQVVAFSQYVVMLVFPVRHLGKIVSNVGRLSVSIKRIREVLNSPKENIEKEVERRAFPEGKLSFEHVSFAYPSAEKNVLEDISFEIGKGQMLGVMGMTGSGKTTLMYLLSHLYPCKSGVIKIGGVDISNINLNTLRSYVGIVLQEPFLYSKTIKENIRLARPEAGDEEVVEVAKKACLHQDIMEMENGYETIVGENGITLSGGQKQRLAIARTLLKNSPIIIFDDSLSSVDTATDAEIRHSISQMRQDKILIVISHRLSSIIEADKIIVLEGGRIAQEGAHSELLLQDGTYKRIYELQNSI